MSKFQHLIDQLTDADELLKQLAEFGDDEFVRLNSLSIKKRREAVASEIDRYLSVNQKSFFVYRILRAGEQRYAAKAVGGALEVFQDLLTSVYDAITNGPKKRFRPSFDSVQKTLLEFGGASAGSVKIFLSTDEDRMLVDDTDLHRALVLVERTLSARTTEDLTDLSEKVGVASIAKAYAWAQHSVENGFSTELTWGQDTSRGNGLFISQDEADRVRSLIAERSDEEVQIIEEVGILHGFDKDTSYFHFAPFDTKDHIKGEVAASVPQKLMTGVPYRAKLALTIVTVFATGEEKHQWMLLSLDAPHGGQSLDS